jgi:serralysin
MLNKPPEPRKRLSGNGTSNRSLLIAKTTSFLVAIFFVLFVVLRMFATGSVEAAPGTGTMFAGITPVDYIWVDDAVTESGDGTLSNPYQTISEAVIVATPGTAILVRAGEYNEKVKFPSRAGGTSTAPIWLLSVDGPQEAHIIAPAGSAYGIQGLGAQNIVIEGFEISGPATRGIQFGMSGSPATDYTLWDDPLTQPTNIVIRGNYIHTTGSDDGIKISQTNNIEILDNTIVTSSSGEDCIDLVATDDAVIARNDCDGSYEAASISVKGGSRRVDVLNNYVHSNIVYPASALGMGGVGGPGELYRPDGRFFHPRKLL